MTQARKLKRTVRARARKTGESYAAARRQVLAARAKARRLASPPDRPQPAPPPVTAPASAKGAVSDARVLATTGRDLSHWFAVLDAFGALERGHTAAARHLREAHGVSSWYSQGITVAYERARGRRALNQRCAGDFEVSVTKVVPVPLERLTAAFERPRERAAWLGGAAPDLLAAMEAGLRAPRCSGVRVTARDLRLRTTHAGVTVEVRVDRLAEGRSRVAVSTTKLPDAAAVETHRRAWRAAMASLVAHVSV